jgi:RNA polymerase sigma-70 factor (ECF subfamily)
MADEAEQTRQERLARFEAVVAEYEARLLRYAARVLQNPDVAQDVVQNAFIRLLNGWKDDLAPSPQLSSWLYRVTHNCAVDHLRAEARRRFLHLRHAEEAPDSIPPDRGRSSLVSDEAQHAVQVLRGLTLREQQLVILKVFEEKSYKEISEITGLTVTNVGYILHIAMKKMAERFRAGSDAADQVDGLGPAGESDRKRNG